MTDEMGAIGCTSYYLDVDNDTCGVESDKVSLRIFGDYRKPRGGDCADDNPLLVSGGTAESCNGWMMTAMARQMKRIPSAARTGIATVTGIRSDP